jgi:transposase InsO family protein
MSGRVLPAPHGYRAPRYSDYKPSQIAPDLVKRNFDVIRPNKVRVTDITYIRTWQGWLYLAVVMDRFSRMIIGWSAGPNLRRELVLNAVLIAVRRRRPRGTIIHSDQGCQYGSDDWRRFCRTNHLEPSMSRRGNCWDNAVAESFFARSEEGADQETHLQEPRAGPGGRVRLHLLVLQSHKAPFSPRRRQPVRPSRPMQSARSNVSTESWVLQTSAWRSSAQDSGTACARF